MTKERLFEIDKRFLAVAEDLDEFTEEDSIVRIGDFGYVEEKVYESMFENDRERREYQALSNIDIKHYIYNTLSIEAERIEKLTDEELDKLLNEQLTTDSCEVYYTTGERDPNETIF